MRDGDARKKSLREVLVRHGKITGLGLVAVLTPIAIVVTSVGRAHKAVTNAAKKVAPGVEALGGVDVALILLLVLLAVCWFLGWLVTRTQWGRRLFEWEEAKYSARSPLMQKYVKKSGKGAPAPTKQPQPALAHVAGGWQPGVIVEEQAGGWASVFVPEIPSVATGRLYCVHADQVLRLDLSLDAFRTKLTATGHGSEAWLQALSAKPDPTGAAS